MIYAKKNAKNFSFLPDFIIYIMSMSALHILECRAGTMSCISYIKYFVSILQSPAQPKAENDIV